MVKKRSALERIEKVVKRKRSLNSSSETTCVPSLDKDRNMLNAHILNLYKAQMPGEPSMKNSCPTSNQELFQKNRTSEGHKKRHNIENSKTEKSIKKSSGLAFERSTLTFSDIGGLDEKVLKNILQMFFHLGDPETSTNLGMPPQRGLLLHGPPGCGKTHVARAIAGEVCLPYTEVAATELVCGISGESESKIRDMFDEAVKNAPCILFIDEIDAVSPKRDSTERGMERRMVSQLLKCLDELNKRDRFSTVMLIGATNRPDSIDPALRCRFDEEFSIGIPDENARLKILQVLCRNKKLDPALDMQWLAHHTPGYLGSDLKCLVTKAMKFGRERIYAKFFNNYIETEEGNSTADSSLLPKFESKHDSELTLVSAQMIVKSHLKIPKEQTNIYFEQRDFKDALQSYIPYTKREGFVTVPDVTWEDVGALEHVKKALQRAILKPVKYKKLYENSQMRTSIKGVLLYGPKGCGKTLLAKAMANEGSINFLSVKGPELLSMYFGESERNVRQHFQKARNCQPCIIYFDEFDALCPNRSGCNANAAADRVVTQLLTEMDGIEERTQVFVIGATNRIDNIDTAIRRPGRLEEILYIGLPSPAERVEILKSLTKNKTSPKISENVDLEQIGLDLRCENYSGADLAYLVREAFIQAMDEYIDSSHSSTDEKIEINLKHFEHAFSKVKSSVSEKDLSSFRSVSEQPTPSTNVTVSDILTTPNFYPKTKRRKVFAKDFSDLIELKKQKVAALQAIAIEAAKANDIKIRKLEVSSRRMQVRCRNGKK